MSDIHHFSRTTYHWMQRPNLSNKANPANGPIQWDVADQTPEADRRARPTTLSSRASEWVKSMATWAPASSGASVDSARMMPPTSSPTATQSPRRPTPVSRSFAWWAVEDLNLRPLPCQGCLVQACDQHVGLLSHVSHVAGVPPSPVGFGRLLDRRLTRSATVSIMPGPRSRFHAKPALGHSTEKPL